MNHEELFDEHSNRRHCQQRIRRQSTPYQGLQQSEAYYPDWASQRYADFHDDYTFNSTCASSVGPAIICFLESEDYVDCIKLAISLGGDADTLAAIAGPMAYAHYKKMPDALVYQALKKLPDWMVDVNERFDNIINKV